MTCVKILFLLVSNIPLATDGGGGGGPAGSGREQVTGGGGNTGDSSVLGSSGGGGGIISDDVIASPFDIGDIPLVKDVAITPISDKTLFAELPYYI